VPKSGRKLPHGVDPKDYGEGGFFGSLVGVHTPPKPKKTRLGGVETDFARLLQPITLSGRVNFSAPRREGYLRLTPGPCSETRGVPVRAVKSGFWKRGGNDHFRSGWLRARKGGGGCPKVAGSSVLGSGRMGLAGRYFSRDSLGGITPREKKAKKWR
jgi:hypothetical protein